MDAPWCPRAYNNQAGRRAADPGRQQGTEKMKKLLFATGLVAVLALSGCFTHVVNEPILVGQLAGPQSEVAGRQARQGVELAVEEINGSENLPLGRRVKVV